MLFLCVLCVLCGLKGPSCVSPPLPAGGPDCEAIRMREAHKNPLNTRTSAMSLTNYPWCYQLPQISLRSLRLCVRPAFTGNRQLTTDNRKPHFPYRPFYTQSPLEVISYKGVCASTSCILFTAARSPAPPHQRSSMSSPSSPPDTRRSWPRAPVPPSKTAARPRASPL